MNTIKSIFYTLAILILLVASYAAFWVIVLLLVGGAVYLVTSVLVAED